MKEVTFEWDYRKEEINFEKHGVTFFEAQHAFLDSKRVIAEDIEHSKNAITALEWLRV